jgi:hypothetical protein
MLIGHILFTRLAVADTSVRHCALALAPMAVLPAWQRRGIGSALIHRGLADARELGHKVVIVLGHPGYYPRFGFQPAHPWVSTRLSTCRRMHFWFSVCSQVHWMIFTAWSSIHLSLWMYSSYKLFQDTYARAILRCIFTFTLSLQATVRSSRTTIIPIPGQKERSASSWCQNRRRTWSERSHLCYVRE